MKSYYKRPRVKKQTEKGFGSRIEFAIFAAIIISISVILFLLLHDTKQALAATIFLAAVIGTIMFWKFRLAIAFLGLVILLLTQTIDLRTAIEFMELDVILFLVGMMVMLALLRQAGFFQWLLANVLKLTKFEPRRLLVVMLVMSALMAALVFFL